MTILPESFPLSQAATANAEVLEAAAVAACEVLPAAGPLAPGEPAPGNLATPQGFAGAALADFEGLVPGAIAVLVGQELVDALASSPLGSLDLAAAVQPALDAAAAALGGRIGAARTVDLELLIADLGHPFTVIPLAGDGGSAALLVNDKSIVAAVEAAAAAAAAVPAPTPALTEHAAPAGVPQIARGLEMLHGVIMEVTVELGRAKMSVRELLSMTPGTVLELDRAAGSPADLLVNGRLIARGEVVVVDEDFGLRVTEIVDGANAG